MIGSECEVEKSPPRSIASLPRHKDLCQRGAPHRRRGGGQDESGGLGAGVINEDVVKLAI